MEVGSLFAGIGGFECMFLQAGFEIGWANELDKDACNTYRANFKHKLLEQDIKDLNPNELEDVGLISAGFPCQAFSIAGLQKGLNDEKGAIVMEMFCIIQAKKPHVLLLENVKNLASHNKGKTLLKSAPLIQIATKQIASNPHQPPKIGHIAFLRIIRHHTAKQCQKNTESTPHIVEI